jgi:hypothetical protein
MRVRSVLAMLALGAKPTGGLPDAAGGVADAGLRFVVAGAVGAVVGGGAVGASVWVESGDVVGAVGVEPLVVASDVPCVGG